MRDLTRAASLILAAAALAACADQPVTLAAVRADGPRLSSASACAASPTFVVHSEAELRAALASAAFGDAIAISGTIPLEASVIVTTAGITFTCAEPGAGLEFAPGFADVLLELYEGYITVSGLELDAEYGFAPIVAFTDDRPEGLEHIRLIGNELECGYTFCLFFAGVPQLEITDNHFQGDSTLFGLQIQGAGTGLVISRNVIENEEAYPALYGGIRVRVASDVTITHNDVRDWSNGIVLTNVYDSRVEHNRIEGSLRDGIDFALIVASRISFSGVSVKGNQVSGSGRAGISVRGACWNTFAGNNVQDNPVNVRFESTTGDNVYRGNHEVVQDGGSLDCDLDGDADPNRISGVVTHPLPDTVTGPSHSMAAAAARRSSRAGRAFPAVQ
jgi:parallel beta-helix repeat protein